MAAIRPFFLRRNDLMSLMF